ncbi:spherical body protein 2 truncated copy 12, putative [Babesia ovis]|uniref:Spherical body protein 2 truncated copy 12, putative n=1 Tax=Babesia ovis TaxID=5869 RepID=A0A9W5T8E4_BABOV|nr:spherical body protein 2 truncated copy 12, putative [Babesia ovis]
MSKQFASSSKLNLSVESRGNGFRKVAKWALGIAAVISATNGIVEAKDEEMPRKVTVERNPNDVVIVTSRGKKYTNKDIEDLIDKKVYLTTWMKHSKDDRKEHVISCELNRRRRNMINAINKFDELVNELPESLANKLVEYPTKAHLTKELTDEIDAYFEKKRLTDAIKTLPEELAQEVANYESMDEIPDDIKDQVDWHLANHRFNGLLERISEELAMEVAKYHSHREIPLKLVEKINADLRKKEFSEFIKRLPTDLAQQAEQYSSFDELPQELGDAIHAHSYKEYFEKILKDLPEDLAQQARKYPTIDDIPEDLLAKMESHLGFVLRHRGTDETTDGATDETNNSKKEDLSKKDSENKTGFWSNLFKSKS